MKKRVVSLAIAGAVMWLASTGLCDEQQTFDPLKRNIIFVEGEAELDVPVDGFELTFSFDVERAGFNLAQRESERIIALVESHTREMGLTDIEIIRGWDLLRQAKISVGSKARKIGNRVTLKVKKFPEGKMQEMITRLIDKTIAIDGSIVLDQIEVLVSEDVQNQKKSEVVQAALKNLQANARQTAEALGRKTALPKRIFVTNDQEVQEVLQEDRESYALGRAPAQKFFSVQKSFKVNTETADYMVFHAHVTGVYEIE